MNPSNSLAAHRIAAITQALRDKALTVGELAERIFLCYEQTRRYVQHLHGAGTLRIAEWRVQAAGRETRLPAYTLGPGRNAVRPAKLTPAQRQAAHIARLRVDGDKYDAFRARDRARKRKVARDPLVAAMFGPGVEARP